MKPLMNLEMAEFFNQMHMMLKSGISGYEALILLLDGAESSAEKELLSQMISTFESTGSLYDAAESTHLFPSYALQMIRLGEETGTLDKIMGALSAHYTREDNIANMLKSALIYPSIMLGMMFVIILVLLMKVMPVFEQVFEQLGQELTGFSAGLIQIGNSLKSYGVFFLILFVVVIASIYIFRNKLPFQKKLQEQIATCRFADGMSIALKSGLTPEKSLELSANLIEHRELQNKITLCNQLMNEGTALHESLKEAKIVTGSYARLIQIAGKSGNIEEAMEQVSTEYEHAATLKINHLIAILEPTLVIILSLIVGAILISVMLPLLGIMSSL